MWQLREINRFYQILIDDKIKNSGDLYEFYFTFLDPCLCLLISGGFAETEHREVTFPEISTTILEKICQYFYWSLQYARFDHFL